ncbi:class II histone deacetylase [Prescottella subtropica]|uniref:class II histone deacetylase n=1 Tax=Prescottella subtropica TaxID=2545757 RepID=UPI0010F9DACD|nr:class II histone deacetylase [Prescottella subtropica]
MDPNKKAALYFDEKCMWHSAGQYALTLPVGGWVQPPSGSGLAESPESKRRLKNLVDVSGLASHLEFRTAPMASEDDIRRIHTAEYLDRFKAVSDAGGGSLGDHAPCGPGTYEIAKLSAGLAQAALDAVLTGDIDRAYVLSRPPGHHALPDASMGFCFLANIAIAVESALARGLARKIAVVDWDVHHGNGTQSIFYGRDDVLTISIHQDLCFPPGYSGVDDRGEGAGLGFNVNVPLQPGGGHAEYLYAMETVVLPTLARFEPDLVVVASGLDANTVDPLARMQAHSETFREMTRMLLAEGDGRLVLVHEGGYSEAYVPFCGLPILEELAGVRTDVVDGELDFFRLQQPGERFQAFQRGLIDEMAAALGLTPVGVTVP